MEKSQRRAVFVCGQCGKESPKWLGRCPECQAWNSFTEQTARPQPKRASFGNAPQELSQITSEGGERFPLPLGEFNRVLGGGVVAGSLVLIAGEPGIGKSTLMLQVSGQAAASRGQVIYVSGEETAQQIKLRAQRLGIKGERLYLLAENNLEAILSHIEQMQPAMVVVDSIQAIYHPDSDNSPGSVTQVRECAQQLQAQAKQSQVPVFITGHVTKEGAIAGPRVLEHIVDVVLYLEGEPFSAYRLLRGIKNRFGSTNEVGVFEMKERGLEEVPNPSKAFLSERLEGTVGSAVVPTLEGSRPLLAEVQALVNPTSFGLPRRTASGVDFNRLLLIAAVLSRRAGLKLGSQDIIVNVTGGLKVSEPAADLAIALAIASSYHDRPVAPALAAVGEVGLNGEIRTVSQLERRLGEAARLGFKRCLVPKSRALPKAPEGMELIPAANVREAISAGLVKEKDKQEE
ncbi:MAG: DNA repair protein RadA [Dehalococcoidia bacterium]|nr:MAG: DNA repair protein RadA [Dehalococcoidia bacterium]